MTVKPPKKYMLCPGYIISKNDGQRHYISPADLVRLYGANPAECVIFGNVPESDHHKYIKLVPKRNGDYFLPEPVGEPEEDQRLYCPKCKSHKISSVQSFPVDKETGYRVRRKKCKDCGHNFRTVQPPETVADDYDLEWDNRMAFYRPQRHKPS